MNNSAPSTTIFPFIRALVESYQAFESRSTSFIRAQGITAPQFEMIAILGKLGPMTCKELCQRTLTSKGTLTGVLDRLAEKGMITRQSATDRRSWQVKLTAEGEALFNKTFPAYVAYIEEVFQNAPPEALQKLTADLCTFQNDWL